MPVAKEGKRGNSYNDKATIAKNDKLNLFDSEDLENGNPKLKTAKGETLKNIFAAKWDSEITYNQNSIVNYNGVLYKSLQAANLNKNPGTEFTWWLETPAIAPEWSAQETYGLNDVVAYIGKIYASLSAGNTNNPPDLWPAWWENVDTKNTSIPVWQSSITYDEDEFIVYEDKIYRSLNDTNLNNQPDTSAAWWVPIIDSGTISIQTSSTTITDDDNIGFLILKTLSSDATINLPAAANNKFRRLKIKNFDSSYDVIIDGNGSETIDGSTTKKLGPNSDWLDILCDGVEWFIFAADYKVNGTPYHEARLTSAIGLPATTWTQIINYTIPSDGVYEVIFSVRTIYSVTDRIYVSMTTNGIPGGGGTLQIGCFTSMNFSGFADTSLAASNMILSLNKGDTVHLSAFAQTAGSTIQGTASEKQTGWSIKKIGN